MKTLKDFILENLIINEGGHAVECRPMTQVECAEVYQDVQKRFLSMMQLTEPGEQYTTLGSFLKKVDTATSGDIDIAVNATDICALNSISYENLFEFIIECVEKIGFKYRYGKGIGLVSIQWPIPNTNDFGQVDIMPTTNMDFTKWMYHSPNFKLEESKYKGLYRNVLLMSIIKNIDKKVISTWDDGEIKEYEILVLNLDKGLYRKTKSNVGKTKRLKNFTTVKELNKFVSNTPQVIIDTIFGEGRYSKDEILTFEETYKHFMEPSFPFPAKREDIIMDVLSGLYGVAAVPGEIMNDFPALVEEFQKTKQ